MTVTINGVSPTTAQQRDFAAAMGLPVLLQAVTVASPQQDIDFTGLDLDADKRYRIELTLVCNAASDQTVKMFYNADFTDANYQIQQTLAFATTTSSTRASVANFLSGGTPPNTNTVAVASGIIGKVAGKSPSAACQFSLMDASNLCNATATHRWTGTANVTAIKLRHASNFGVGTVAKIYKI